jgi:hypothetical protein
MPIEKHAPGGRQRLRRTAGPKGKEAYVFSIDMKSFDMNAAA